MNEKYAYALLRVDSEGVGYDVDYPVVNVFLNKIVAETYMQRMIEEMIEEGELDEDADDDDVFIIEKVPLITIDEEEL